MIRKLVLTCIHAACCLALLIGSAQAQLNLADGTASGQWYNPARDGEGFYVEIIDTGGNLQIAVAMYSYDEAGNQLWLVGNVAIADGDVGARVPVFRVEGPVWGTQYDPADRQTTEFGAIYTHFPSCDVAMFDLRSNDPTLESGIYPLRRLTEIVGMDCMDPPPAPGEMVTPGQWTGEGICFFVNTEDREGAEPGTDIEDSDLCNGFSVDADIAGVEVNLKGETGEACQATIQCQGTYGINLPGPDSYGVVPCETYGYDNPENASAVQILFNSATESVVKVAQFAGPDGTLCIGEGPATPAQ
jgi:hypothetical protein